MSEWLGSLRITKEDISEVTTETETTNAMLTVLAPAVQNEQVVMPKSMVLDLKWFNRDRMKFED